MNERDKELAVRCRLLTKHTGGIYTDALQEFADLIRADERGAILKLADSLGWVNVDHIQARGNT